MRLVDGGCEEAKGTWRLKRHAKLPPFASAREIKGDNTRVGAQITLTCTFTEKWPLRSDTALRLLQCYW